MSNPNLSNSFAFCCITFFKDPVEATGKGQNYSLDKGSSVRFKCPVDGNPEPNITWYNGSTVPISFEKELESRESGCYTCVADNSLGKSVNVTQCLTISTGKLCLIRNYYFALIIIVVQHMKVVQFF